MGDLKVWSKERLEKGYEIIFEFQRAFVSGGGLRHSVHVLVEIDSDEIFKTQDQPSPPIWNEKLSLFVHDFQTPTPSTVRFSVFKKRWTSHGYKLVGCHNIPLLDLLSVLDRGREKVDVDLTPNRRNLTLHGNLIFSVEVKSLLSDETLKTPLLSRQKSLSSVDRNINPTVSEASPSISSILYEVLVEDLGDYVKQPVNRLFVIQLSLLSFVILLACWIYLQQSLCHQNVKKFASSLESLKYILENLNKEE